MLKYFSLYFSLIRITLHQQFHQPIFMLNLTVITALCVAVLQLSGQLVAQVMYSQLPVVHGENSYQLHMQQGPLAIDGYTMLYPDTLYELSTWNVTANVLTQQAQISEWKTDNSEHRNIARLSVSLNYMQQLALQVQLGSLTSFDSQSAVIDQAFWQHNLFSDPNVIGTLIELDGLHYRITAVLNGDSGLPILPSIKEITDRSQRPGLVLTSTNQGKITEQTDSKVLLQSPDIILQTRLSHRELEQAVQQWSDKYNQQTSRAKQVSFSIMTLRKAIYGSWYYMAPGLFLAALLILAIGLTTIGNLCLANSAKSQRNAVCQYVLGAERWMLWLKDAWQAFTISVVANAIAFTLCCIFSKLLNSINMGLALDQLTPSLMLLALSIVVLWLLLFSLLTLPRATMDLHNLAQGLASSGKGQSGRFNLVLMKRLINVQVFAISTFLLLGISYLTSNVSQLLPLLQTNYQQLAYVQVHSFRDNSSSQASQGVLLDSIKQQLNDNHQISDVAMLGADPMILSLSLALCNQGSRSTMISKSYVSMNVFSLLNSPILAGAIPERLTQNQVIIDQQAAIQLFGNVQVIGQKLPCSGSIGERQVVAVVKIGRFIPPQISSFIPAGQPLIFSQFDWYKMDISGAKKATFLIKYHQKIPYSLINKITKQQQNSLQLTPLTTLEQQMIKKGHDMRLSILISLTVTIATILIAGYSLYGGLSYQTQLRQHQLAVCKCLGMAPFKLVTFIVKDTGQAIIVSLVAAMLLTTALDWLFARQAVNTLSLSITVITVLAIYLVASIYPSIQLLRNDNTRDLLY
ncbi:MAG: hypothetical protein HRU25_02880 [Psychrobium sp.]|nr:hypothetical protein [Psychrobium sp.]